MIDFMMVSTRLKKNGVVEIYPKFIIKNPSEHLMIRGGDFYAIWVEERGLWSVNEQDVIEIVDREVDRYAKENAHRFVSGYQTLHMWDAESGIIDSWHKYCQRQMRDSFRMLDEKLIFSNMETGLKDYASKKLPYPIETGEPKAWDRMLDVLYAPEERHKIEWAIGSIVSGESRKLQKFMVFYGAAGTGKSTVINVIEQLFEGYTCVFQAKALGSSSNSFALEAFRDNPLVAIEHDGDLSKIEDNTRLNSLVSHEKMSVNEKFKSSYANRFKCFLFMGTNRPVQITDAKSGLIRRLIDVSPTGEKIPPREYKQLIKQITFELGSIANQCQQVYLANPGAYDDYIPVKMLGASNDFYNFVMDSWVVFKKEDDTTLKAAWEMYKTYCDDTKVPYPYPQRKVKEELKNYFREYKEREILSDGTRVRNYYRGFRYEKFEESDDGPIETAHSLLVLDDNTSLLDNALSDCFAQYGSESGTPLNKWINVRTKLCELDTARLHYVKMPCDHIVIDFDMVGTDGEKDFEKNLEEASKWPPTYAEVSKSGKGIHLHYIYTGDPSRLSCVYDNRIEVKVFTGNASLRRQLTRCNNLPIATLSYGLPLKEAKKTVSFDSVQSEKGLRSLIERNLRKEIHPGTKPSVDFIYKILEDAYASDLSYDVSDMQNVVIAFAAGSTHQAEYCLKQACQMRFKSKEGSEGVNAPYGDCPLVFYDVEVFPNLLLVNYKVAGEGKPIVRMINPKPAEVEQLLKFKLIGFNCRRYDNHILYGALMGYNNEQIYKLSSRIISGDKSAFFGEAYNASYTDVYDFAAKKQSLKKWEIELGIHHQELGLPWDQPVPEEMWERVAEYCDNDVIATEAVFNKLKGDFTARQILADVAGMTVNDTTNTLTTRIIFGSNRKPQDGFNYRNLGGPMRDGSTYGIVSDTDPNYTVFEGGKPIFPGYRYEGGKSIYRDEEVGEGGYVYAEPGMYGNVALLDIASMHPSSIVAEKLFGETYTARFKDILDARMAIKHKDFDKARKMLNGALARYLTDENAASDLAQALKIAINSVYGLTSANFENPFRDKRNIDNIVAKRGALFMINLKHEVQKRGFTVAHIKTDSIKIPDATPEIIQFVTRYGKEYGYTFEHEATFDRMCLVNDAVYIAKYKDGKNAGQWTATGTQFQIPYVFKTLFTKEDIEFDDMCETKAVTSALYLDFDEGLPKDEHNYRFIGKVGRFCPIKEGCGGGLLMREMTKKTGEKSFAAATGSKGYRWLESEMVKESDIDRSYYDKLADDAKKSISSYGDFKWFVSDEPYFKSHIDGPPWLMPCGKSDCLGCEHWKKAQTVDQKLLCDAGYECIPF